MSENSEKTLQQQRGIKVTVLCVVFFIILIIVTFVQGITRTPILSKTDLKNNGIYLFEQPRSLNSFSLLDGNNKAFTPAVLSGKWSFVFFGFTYCPDICPTTMALLKRFYEKQIDTDYAADTQIILVSVDPGRDTPEKIQQYVKFFHQDFTGVTGNFLDLHRFATQLNVPFAKVPGGGENYTIDHGGNIAIINPKGHYVGFFRSPLNVTMMDKGYDSIRYWFGS